MEISLCKWTMEDAQSLQDLADNSHIADKLTNAFPHPYTISHAESYIQRAMSDEIAILRAIKSNSKLVGAIGLHPLSDIFSPSAELGYWVGEEYWSRGIATSAIRKIVQVGFGELTIERIFARPFGSNIGSQKALIKSGFTLEAKFHNTILKNGRFEDELIFGIRRENMSIWPIVDSH